jgi:hypothetical protein
LVSRSWSASVKYNRLMAARRMNTRQLIKPSS